ncbi:cellulose binding domain-containing protein [Plantactinospora siamensis]
MWPFVAAAVALPVAAVGLATAPAAGADTGSTLMETSAPPSTPPSTPLSPTAPTDLTATSVTSTSVTLTWTASTPGCCPIQAYNIMYAQPFLDTIPMTMVGNVTTATLQLRPTTEYHIRVQARDEVQTSSWSKEFTVMTPATDTGPDTVPPTAPGTLSVQNGTLSWTPSTDNIAVTGYNVYHFDGWYTSTLVGTATTTTYPVPPAPKAGPRNQFYVRARDAAGNLSIASNAVDAPEVTPTTPPPPTPTCAVSYHRLSEWRGGFIATVTIKNTTGAAVDGWTLDFSFPGDQRITSAWSASYTQSGNAVTVHSAGWNGGIAAGRSVSFGIQGTWTASDAAPTSFTLNGGSCATA